MITCCTNCPNRWVENGKTCHSECKRYQFQKAVAKIKNEKKRFYDLVNHELTRAEIARYGKNTVS